MLSLSKSLTSADRDCEKKSIATRISETRGNLKKKNNDSVGTSVGTQGIVHTMHTTNDKIRIK